MEPLATPEQVELILGVKSATLRKWRNRRIGPAFIKLGNNTIRYREDDLRAFIEECMAVGTDRPERPASPRCMREEEVVERTVRHKRTEKQHGTAEAKRAAKRRA